MSQASSKVWTSESFYAAAEKQLRGTKVAGKRISKEAVKEVWENLGYFVTGLMEQGKPVTIPKLALFTFYAQAPGRVTKDKAPMMVLSPEFTRACGARQRKGGKPDSTTPTRLNYLALSAFSNFPKDVCRKVVEAMIWNITFAINKSVPAFSLEIPGLGVFDSKNNVCSFTFGEPRPELDDGSDDDNSWYEQGEQHAEEDNNDVGEYMQRGHSPLMQDKQGGARSMAASASKRLVIPASVDRLREKLKQRNGSAGIQNLARTLKIMDSSGDGYLSKEELQYGLQKVGVKVNAVELDEMFAFFDRDRNGKLSFDEFLCGLRGPMSERRLKLINIAFDRLDRDGNGTVTVEDLEMVYDPSFYPEVQQGKMTAAQALRVFLDQFDTLEKDGLVSRDEFLEYYKNVSASIDKDDYFELMMRNAWHISGGKGQYANTTNRRVLVTHQDGTQTVEEVKDDLWVEKTDMEEIQKRLEANGVKTSSKKDIGLYYASDSTSAARRKGPPASLSRNKQAQTNPFVSSMSMGDEALPTTATGPVEETETTRDEKNANPIEKLGDLLKKQRLTADTFLLKIGANRVLGDATIDVAAFVRGLRRLDSSISEKDAKKIARMADADQNGSINVTELCAQLEGKNAVDRLKQVILKRGGMNGMASLTRTLRVLDSSKDNCLDAREVMEGFQKFGLKLTSGDVKSIFAYFDRDKNGKISIDEFLVGLRGDLNKRRKALVETAFQRLDYTGDGVITVEDLADRYDPTQSPEFKSGQKTKKQVLEEFLACFDGNKDGTVTPDEFLEYYKGVSASIDSDDYFELMIRNAWHISGGQGQYENTSNRRVLVTDKDGRQFVREIKDDFLVDTNDKAEVRRRLGVSDNTQVDYTYSTDSMQPAKKKAPTALLAAKKRAIKQNSNRNSSTTSSNNLNDLGPPQRRTVAWGRAAGGASALSSTKRNGTKSRPKNSMFSNQAIMGDESMPQVDDEDEEEEEEEVYDMRTAPRRTTFRPKGETGHSRQKKKSSLGKNQREEEQLEVAASRATRDRLERSMKRRGVAEPPALGRLREKVIERGGTNGIHTLGRVLKIMDDSGDRALDREELKYGLQDYGVQCTDAECEQVFKYLDRDNSGKISFDEFLVGLRGPISERRVQLILTAFKRLDRTGDGVVTVQDLESVYDVSFHPDVKSGKLTKSEALREFLRQFDTIDQDGIVTEDEFIEYYKSVSASIDSDDYFELMMRNAWHISGGKGQYANTSNRRVLVTKADGSQSVEEVQDDLWVDKNDEAEMKRRLAQRGVHASGSLGYTYGTDQTTAAKRAQPARLTPHTSSISLAWEDEADRQGISKAQLDKKLQASRQRERIMRSGAAERIQKVIRDKKAVKEATLYKNKIQKARIDERIEEQDRYLSQRGTIRRTSLW